MRRKVWLIVVVLMLTAAVLSAGCAAGDREQPAGNEPVVVTTIYPVWDFAGKVCGDRARVVQMVPDGAEPHEWEPSPRDMQTLEQADVFIYNGAGMESWVTKILTNLSSGDAVLVDCSTGIETLPVEGGAGTDPHLWLDPLIAMRMVDNIVDGMEKAVPGEAGYFQNNARVFKENLQSLHNQYTKALSTAKQRKFVISHAAFGYLARQYGLEQVPIAGITHEAQPGPARVAKIIKTIEDNNIKYIFDEQTSPGRLVRAVADDTGAEIVTLSSLGGLTRAEREAGREYLAVMKENLEKLSPALEVDENGY